VGIDLGTLFTVGVLYLCALFAVAWLTDRNIIPAALAGKPFVYTLSLGVFACGWSLFGMTAVAEGHGYGYLAYFAGTSALFLFAPLLLLPLLGICRRMQFTSIADLLAYRYRGAAVGALVTAGMLAAAMPLMAAQIRVVSNIASLLGNVEPREAGSGSTALAFAAAIAVFAILFGARPISERERHNGLVMTMAFESLVKLGAFLLVGMLATQAAFGDLAEMGTWLEHNTAATGVLAATRSSETHGHGLMFFGAATGLQHLLHMALHANPSMRSGMRASWGFPLFLLLISLPVLPVLWSGMRLGISGPAEYYAASIGVATGSGVIAFAAFIAGLSAASSAIIVTSLALASMSLNNFVLPLYRPGGGKDLYRGLEVVRSILIGLVILSAHVFYTVFADRSSLETLGFSSFVAAAQFFPGTLALLYWPGANRAGFAGGLLAGFGVWLLALLGPDRGHSAGAGDELATLVQGSHWGIAAVQSLALNTLVLVGLSWLTRQSQEEREAAQACNAANPGTPPGHRSQLRSPLEFMAALQPALGAENARLEVRRALEDLGYELTESRSFALRQLRDRIEANLSRLMGATVAMDVVANSLPSEAREASGASDDLYLVDSRLDRHRRDLTGLAAELDAMRRFYRDTLQELPIGVCGIHTNGEIVMWNQAVENMTGVSANAVLGSAVDALPAPWSHLLASIPTSGRTRSLPQKVELGERSAWISLHGTAAGADAETRFLLLEDVTGNRLLQEELFHSERLASIGRLAAGVAHEIGNPLTGIDCLAQNLLAESGDAPAVEDGARQILRQTHRIGNIVGTLVNFAHHGSGPEGIPEPLDPALCADEAIYLIGLDQRGHSVEFVNSCPQGLRIAGDGQKLLQVFVNLLSNARDASSPGGCVRIDARSEGDDVVVMVSDEGIGIPQGKIDKIFEPFFTTKAPGEGTGLGLALVYAIVTAMGGTVAAESPLNSATGRGTRMVLRFPACPQSAMENPPTRG
jgi:signal transduction histidine kinase/Na+/proline symporter